MPYEVEPEGHRSSGGAFLAGLMMGAAIGAGLALLFAPKKGSELRGQIADSAKKARESARQAYAQATQTAGAAASRAMTDVDRIVGRTRGQQS